MTLDIVEYSQAYLRFRQLTKSAANRNTRLRFYQFINANSNTCSLDDFINDEAIRRIKLLAGPDGEVYYRIMKAQQDDR